MFRTPMLAHERVSVAQSRGKENSAPQAIIPSSFFPSSELIHPFAVAISPRPHASQTATLARFYVYIEGRQLRRNGEERKRDERKACKASKYTTRLPPLPPPSSSALPQALHPLLLRQPPSTTPSRTTPQAVPPAASAQPDLPLLRSRSPLLQPSPVPRSECSSPTLRPSSVTELHPSSLPLLRSSLRSPRSFSSLPQRAFRRQRRPPPEG